jgi:hydroxymethylpyrimidine kinase / phosphomethylpyrimidine kinase / thiamine-phosphate diphosphorylase
MPVVLTIAGSDPSGGAGIQSDLRTIERLGTIGLSAITALTVQNSQGVRQVHPVSAAVLTDQLRALFEDSLPDAIKIGMLGGMDQVRAVAAALGVRSLRNIVLDPVFASTGGVPLLDVDGKQALLDFLMPLCDIITPNLSEASMLSGLPVEGRDSILLSGNKLLDLGAKAVLIKGGHSAGQPSDWLFQRDQDVVEFPGERIVTEHTHGTGCLLSSVIAVHLAHGSDLVAAVAEAKSVVSNALQNPVVVGKGRGYPLVTPSRNDRDDRTHTQRITRLHGIYVVTDPVLQRGRSMEEVAVAALRAGANIIQLRDKTKGTPELIDRARRLNEIVRSFDKLFIVNDRVDVALASGADGVHLGPDDMHPRDVRRLLGPNKLVGVSTGTVQEAVEAQPYASYLGVGCIFGTSTKSDAGEPVGTGRITEIIQAVPTLPTVAIGGITRKNITQVIAAGATSAAVVSAIVGADDVEEATTSLAAFFG